MEKHLLEVFFLSAIPLSEQRLAIPLGILVYNLNPLIVMIVSLLGSLLPVIFLLLFFKEVFYLMKKIDKLKKLNDFIENKLQKNIGKVEKYKEVGLITFVGIPLPTTGLWTGSAVASIMGLNLKKSFLCIFLGGVLSAILITTICLIFPSIFHFK